MSKSLDTNLSLSERKSLRGFVALYLFLFVLIALILGFGYVDTQKSLMFERLRPKLNSLANEQIKRLKYLHIHIDKERTYPRSSKFISGIYDKERESIFSLLKQKPQLDQIIYEQDGHIFYIKELQAYYLGAKYLALRVKDDRLWLKHSYMNLLYFGIPLTLVFLSIGYFLLRLFLKPMREAVVLLDNFIKDTTHELNTPISAILSNVEMMDEEGLDEKNKKRLKRINIATRVVSSLYEDLVYISLGGKIASDDEKINLKNLIEERIEYFSFSIGNKKLKLTSSLTDEFIYMDKNKLTKLIDNLISNAIKYNIKGGVLKFVLANKTLCVYNSAKINFDGKLDDFFKRYKRGDKKVGVFGIGLHIVAMVAQEYSLDISLEKQKGGLICARLSWS